MYNLIRWRTSINGDFHGMWTLIHIVERNIYICFAIIALLLLAIIVILLIKRK